MLLYIPHSQHQFLRVSQEIVTGSTSARLSCLQPIPSGTRRRPHGTAPLTSRTHPWSSSAKKGDASTLNISFLCPAHSPHIYLQHIQNHGPSPAIIRRCDPARARKYPGPQPQPRLHSRPTSSRTPRHLDTRSIDRTGRIQTKPVGDEFTKTGTKQFVLGDLRTGRIQQYSTRS